MDTCERGEGHSGAASTAGPGLGEPMPWREATPDDGENAHACGCHIWTGYTTPEGQPVVRTATSQTTARRAAWQRENGPVPEGMVLTALCGETLCVRPSHHEPVTVQTIRYRTGWTKRDRQMRRTALRLKMLGWSGRRIADALAVDEATVRAVLRDGYYDPAAEKTREI